MSDLEPNCCLEFDFQKVDQHTGGKWLIHNTKRRKDNQLQSLKFIYVWVCVIWVCVLPIVKQGHSQQEIFSRLAQSLLSQGSKTGLHHASPTDSH